MKLLVKGQKRKRLYQLMIRSTVRVNEVNISNYFNPILPFNIKTVSLTTL